MLTNQEPRTILIADADSSRGFFIARTVLSQAKAYKQIYAVIQPLQQQNQNTHSNNRSKYIIKHLNTHGATILYTKDQIAKALKHTDVVLCVPTLTPSMANRVDALAAMAGANVKAFILVSDVCAAFHKFSVKYTQDDALVDISIPTLFHDSERRALRAKSELVQIIRVGIVMQELNYLIQSDAGKNKISIHINMGDDPNVQFAPVDLNDIGVGIHKLMTEGPPPPTDAKGKSKMQEPAREYQLWTSVRRESPLLVQEHMKATGHGQVSVVNHTDSDLFDLVGTYLFEERQFLLIPRNKFDVLHLITLGALVRENLLTKAISPELEAVLQYKPRPLGMYLKAQHEDRAQGVDGGRKENEMVNISASVLDSDVGEPLV